MKQINFLNSVSAHEQHAITVWYRVTILLFCVTIVGIIIVQSYQFKKLHNIKQQKEMILKQKKYDTAVLDLHKKLISQEKELQNKHNFVKQFMAQRAQFLELLINMQKALSQGAEIKSATITPQQICVSLACASAQAAYTYKDLLAANTYLDGVRITSLQPYKDQNQTRLLAAIVGSVKPIA